MNGWLDGFPVRSRDYELRVAVDVQAELADDLEGDELRVARHLLGEWATEPGGLTAKLRQVEGMRAEERREVAAAAYRGLGVETPSERAERERIESLPVPHRPLLECAVCGTPPRDSLG